MLSGVSPGKMLRMTHKECAGEVLELEHGESDGESLGELVDHKRRFTK